MIVGRSLTVAKGLVPLKGKRRQITSSKMVWKDHAGELMTKQELLSLL